MSALAAGQIDLTRIGQGDIAAVNGRPGLAAVSKVTDEVLFLILNTAPPLFADKAVREGIAYAFDREAINRAVYGDEGAVTDILYYEGSAQHASGLPASPYDPGKAKLLIEQSGLPTGTSISVLVQNQPAMVTAAEVVQSPLKAVGIEVRIELSQNLFAELQAQPDSFIASATNYALPPLYLISSSFVEFGYNDAAFDAAFARVQGATTPAELTGANRDLQTRLATNLPIFFFAQESATLGMSEKVHGLGAVRGDNGGVILTNVWIAS